MTDLNRVVLIGRLTREAELKYTASGQAICKFSIAVNRSRKVGEKWEDEANFFDIVYWGKPGESVHPYLAKGKMVGVDGELRQDRWKQEDGQNRSKIEIVANFVQLLGGTQGGQGGQFQGAPQSSGGGAASYNAPPKDDGFADDIPF
ncbi:MAG: single-stranded DNA-binding protein [Spirochaetes bacterium]|nr:single-stranded DNA-binding protein [Spirochaetota bacterium]